MNKYICIVMYSKAASLTLKLSHTKNCLKIILENYSSIIPSGN